jgi:hypothetical protein
MGLGSGKKLFRIPDPGPEVKKAPDSGSATLILGTFSSPLFRIRIQMGHYSLDPVWESGSRQAKTAPKIIKIITVAKKFTYLFIVGSQRKRICRFSIAIHFLFHKKPWSAIRIQ